MKLVIFAIAVLFSSACLAAPSKDAATKWAQEFRAAKSKSFDALILKDKAKARSNMQEIARLRDKAEKIFGNYHDCYLASSNLVEVYQSEIELANGSHNANIAASGMAGMAWSAGQRQESCETQIDAIK